MGIQNRKGQVRKWQFQLNWITLSRVRISAISQPHRKGFHVSEFILVLMGMILGAVITGIIFLFLLTHNMTGIMLGFIGICIGVVLTATILLIIAVRFLLIEADNGE